MKTFYNKMDLNRSKTRDTGRNTSVSRVGKISERSQETNEQYQDRKENEMGGTPQIAQDHNL